MGLGTYKGQTAPSEIIISGPRKGVWMAHGGVTVKITSDAFYYAKDDNCDYKWIWSASGNIVTRAVGFKDPNYIFYVGRASTSGFINVGKVTLEHKVIYFNHDGKEKFNAAYEVLTCDKVVIEHGATGETVLSDAFVEFLISLLEHFTKEIEALREENELLRSGPPRVGRK